MKKTLYLFVVVAAFAACKGKNSELNANKEMVVLTDSSYSNASYLSDTGAVSNTEEFINNGVVVSGKSTVPERAVSPRKTTRSSSNNNSGTYNNNSGSGTSSEGTTTRTTRRSGVSKAAKGAIIGGVGGAVAGGIIGKSGKGAVIGGVVGAAGGYIIGRSKDRRDGRVRN